MGEKSWRDEEIIIEKNDEEVEKEKYYIYVFQKDG